MAHLSSPNTHFRARGEQMLIYQNVSRDCVPKRLSSIQICYEFPSEIPLCTQTCFAHTNMPLSVRLNAK